jgi:hypothetical protein
MSDRNDNAKRRPVPVSSRERTGNDGKRWDDPVGLQNRVSGAKDFDMIMPAAPVVLVDELFMTRRVALGGKNGATSG